MEVASQKIVGYFDEFVELPRGMTSYSWGYLVAVSVEGVAAAFRPLVWESQRLRKEGPLFVRSEVWTHANPTQGWAKIRTEDGLPKAGTVERVLLIEPDDGETKFIRFGCSAQGNVTDPIVQELRPDLRQ